MQVIGLHSVFEHHAVMTRAALDEIVLGEAKLAEKLAAGEARIDGNPQKLVEFLSLLDTFEFWFNIVTP